MGLEEQTDELSALEEDRIRLQTSRTRLNEELAQLQEQYDTGLITQRQLEAGTALKNQIIDFSPFQQMRYIKSLFYQR